MQSALRHKAAQLRNIQMQGIRYKTLDSKQATMKIHKSELLNILNQGWQARRTLLKARSEKNSQRCQEWKKREKRIELGLEPPPTQRRSNYIE